MKKILVVDDSKVVRLIHKRALEEKGFICIEAENGIRALEILRHEHERIYTMVIDQEMPEMGGDELVSNIKSNKLTRDIPVIFVSSINESSAIKSSLGLGIYDYLIKPIDNEILCLKVKNAVDFYEHDLELKVLNDFVSKRNEELESVVAIRTEELNKMLFSLLNILENANYYNDNDTGNHIIRVGKYAEIIAVKYGIDDEVVKHIKLFSSIHDIGKVGISESILKKNGKLTTEEFETMKNHVLIGYKMIKDSPLPAIAKNIVRYHHEKWNGRGYLEGLNGKEIPIESRIVSISDVFDALISKRVYKEAFSLEKVIEILKEEKGESFQPEMVEIVLENIKELFSIREKYKD